jgi:Domain of unknown function (DUF5753)
MRRQRRLTGAEPLQLAAIMSESTIRQQVGGPKTLADQLRHLVTMSEQHGEDSLDLRVVPYTATGHPAIGGSGFYLMTFPSGQMPTIAYQETVTSTDLITDQQTVREYSLAYTDIENATLSRAETIQWIDKVARELA